jgi:hypothetical protein
MKPTYTKLAADGSDLPADHPNKGPGKHLAVRVDHPALAKPIVVAAYRCKGEHTFPQAQKVAAKHKAYGWNWRAAALDEAFFIPDRTNADQQLDKNFFPDAEGYEFTWTSDAAASSPSDHAWLVGLGDGYCYRGYQGDRGRVRAVLAGQS